MLILAEILATSGVKKPYTDGLSGDPIYDGGCKHSFGTYGGKPGGSYRLLDIDHDVLGGRALLGC